MDDTALLKRREDLQGQLAPGVCKTLFDVVLDGPGRLIQRLTRSPRPISPWYAAVAIGLAAWVVGFVPSVLLGELTSSRLELAGLSAMLLGAAPPFLMAVRAHARTVAGTLRDHLVDATESLADLADLGRWLALLCDVKRHALWSVVFGILMGGLTAGVFSTVGERFLGFGPTILLVLATCVSGSVVYYLSLLMAFALRTSRYQIKLYAVDPRHSEVIARLSDVMNGVTYMMAVFVAIANLLYALWLPRETPASVPFWVVVGWGPLTALFALNQYALTRIITRAKWKTLNGIQAQIEALHAEDEIPTEDTLARIRALIDYHDHIRATRNSALDLSRGLSFLNSLLLPLIAFLLGNLDKVLALFSQ